MKKLLYKLGIRIQHILLKRKGFQMKDNVTISQRGVRKIGEGKIVCENNVNINAEVMFIAFRDITIGENSTIAYRAILSTSANPNAPYNKLCELYKPIHESIHIGKDYWIGAGAIILPGVTIGNGCVVAAGAVVNKDVPDNVMIAGVPATIKKRLYFKKEEN